MNSTDTKLLVNESVKHNKWIFGLIAIYLFFLVWGIQNNLPYLAEIDEPAFVMPALRIASSGNLNPGWFGQPGSTTIYPMAFLFHFWFALVEGGALLHSNPQLVTHFQQDFAVYYYLGRFVSIGYAVLTLPFIYWLGCKVFSWVTGFVGSVLFIFYPYLLYHAQMTRPDSATVFFVTISLWLMFWIFEKPVLSRHLWAGLVIGFSISTKYVLAALGPVYCLICLAHIWKSRKTPHLKGEVRKSIAGLFMIAVGFAVSTPYFLLDFETAWGNVLIEARSEHLGADGLSRVGNFWFYLTSALPTIMGWPQLVLSYFALGVALWQRQRPQLILIAFVVIYLIGISISPLHWVRWALQILPVLVLFAAEGIRIVADFLGNVWLKRPQLYPYIFITLVLLVSIEPIYDTVLHDIKQANSSTRILAREWLVEHAAPGSKIGQEWYTAPLEHTTFEVFDTWALGQDRIVANYYDEGFDYLVVSSGMYNRFYADPERSPAQVQFYDSLSETALLVQEIEPTLTRGGPTIRIYQLSQ